MGAFGFGRSQIPYGMFDLVRDAEEAKRFARCERVYHQGQNMAWDGKEILPMLLAQHGGIRLEPEKRDALKSVFAIIMWGELAAWKISAQLADRLIPLEAKMAATSQAHDEARHFYTMFDYLKELGYTPRRLHRAPEALLDAVLGTDDLAYKLVGMQLMIETIALSLFQGVRESGVEPVLCELLKYYERDEARHVGLGVQYLPEMLKRMGPLGILRISAFQVRLLTYALWESKVLEKDLAVLGINPRKLIEGARRKQVAAMQQAFESVGMPFDRDDNLINRGVEAAIEYFFPWNEGAPTGDRMRAAWRKLSARERERLGHEEFAAHEKHAIKTARGTWAEAE